MNKKIKFIKSHAEDLFLLASILVVAVGSSFLLYRYLKTPRAARVTRLAAGEPYYFQGKSNLYQAKIGDKKSNEPKVEFTLGKENKSISFTPASARTNIVKPSIKGNKITFKDVYQNTDFTYQTIPLGIKEEIIVNQVNGISIYPFYLETNGVHPKYFAQNIAGGVFYDEAGKYLFHFEKPFAVDAKKARTDKVGITIKKEIQTGKLVALLVVDKEWLNSPVRLYPIIIDPTVIHDTTAEFAPGQLNRVVDAGGQAANTGTGGTITYSGGYTIHTFTSSGTFTPTASGNVEVLVVGGGGGGGSHGGGGGGSGGLIYNSSFAVTNQAYQITVGAGGAGAENYGRGSNGGNSVFDTLTAYGGGGGAGQNIVPASNGGSGGGGSGGTNPGQEAGSGTSGQGNDGGVGLQASGTGGRGGGGGGAGAVGGSGTSSGNGGNGTANSISGSSVTYAGGGGGGTVAGSSPPGPGSGGTGGGGNGGDRHYSGPTNGTANTGGGGGGSGGSGPPNWITFLGGSGGSGIVIVRYPTTISPNLTTNYQELPADINTVGLWHMNEASGNVLDSSGNNITGASANTTVVSGLFGNARSFNNTNTYLEIPANNVFNFGTNDWTFETWIKPSNFEACDTIFSQNNPYTILRLYCSDATKWEIYNNSVQYIGPAHGMIAGNWYHIAVVRNNNTIYLYQNGNLLWSFAVSTNPTNLSGAIWRIGNSTWGGEYFNGVIDEFRVSKVARTPEEIKLDASRRPYSVYTSDVIDLTAVSSWNSLSWTELGVNTGDGEILASSTSLVAQWNFNETSGTTAAVAAGSCGASCNGTLTNFASTASQDQAAGTGWTAANRRWGAGALMFDGSDDYVTCTDANCGGTTKLDVIGTTISVGAWIYHNSAQTGVILSKGGSPYQFSAISDNTIQFCLQGSCQYSAAVLTTSTWQYVVATYDGSTIRYYLNGRLVDTDSLSVTLADGATAFTMGADLSGAYVFNGTIDSTAIYSRALGASEILSNYQAGNVELQTRVGADTSPDDGSWEAWKPTTGETAIASFDEAPKTTFSYTGSSQTYTVPSGIYSIYVKTWGAGGGSTSPGGGGGYSNGWISVTPGENVTVLVGGKGLPNSGFTGGAGGFGGGGVGGTGCCDAVNDSGGAGGGGRSEVVAINGTITAGGGGGGASGTASTGGSGGGSTGENGAPQGTACYGNGTGGIGGIGGGSGTGGAGGTGCANGSSGSGSGTAGTSTNGGTGGSDTSPSRGRGGGGGGGGYGGGGGGGASDSWSAGTGAGGGGRTTAGGTTLSGSGSTPSNASDPDRGTAGNPNDNGKVIIYTTPWDTTSAYIPQMQTNDNNIKIEGTSSLKQIIGQPQIDANTVGLWHMEETGGTGAYIKDSTTNANHGTPTGTTVVNGFSGKARSFVTNDYITHPTTNISPSAFSIEMWVKPNWNWDDGIAHGLWQNNNNTNVNQANWVSLFKWSGNQLYFRVANPSAGLQDCAPTATNYFNAGKWTHVAAAYSSAGMFLYINGSLVCSTGAITVPNAALDTNGRIGFGHQNSFGNGVIDEVRISNTARSAEEIAEAYRAGRDHYLNRTISSTDLSAKTTLPFYVAADRPGTYLEATIGESAYANYQTDANTVGLWHLGEQSGSGAYIKDSSSNANNGTPTGTTFAQGKIGKGRSFNGTSDYIIAPNSSSLQITAYTVEAWVKPSVDDDFWTGIVGKPGRNFNMWLGQSNTSSGYIHHRFRDSAGTNSGCPDASGVPIDGNTWTYIVLTNDGTTCKTYFNGVLQVSGSITGSLIADVTDLQIGRNLDGGASNYFRGTIDEVRISNTARTADQIRQAYEMGARTHNITIDFKAALNSGNLIANTSDLSFTIDATAFGAGSMGSNLYKGDKIIVKENYDGTEYIAQGTVTAVTASTGAVTVAAWDSGSTVPSGGFTVNAVVFKWQREYFDLKGSLSTHRDAVTNLTLRVTDGSQGANVWLDDFRSSGGYLTTPGGSTITSSTGNRYFQYRVIPISYDPAVSASFTAVTLDYTSNVPPATPSLDLPTNTATNQSLIPTLKTTTTDPDSDYLRYKIQLCTNQAMTENCQTFDQTSSQTGWSGQNTQSNTAYTSGTQGVYTVQTNLSTSTTYYWRSYAIDPGGSNSWSSTQGTPYSFTTTTAPSAPTTPYAEGQTNPTGILDTTPEFSAIHNDTDGDSANYYEIEVNTNSGFTGTVMWDSGQQSMTTTANTVRSPDISYAGSSLSWNTTYYWRIRFWDTNGAVGAWSATQNFTMNNKPNTPTLDLPLDSATATSLLPVLKTTATDADSDYLRYKIQICTNVGMTTNCQTFDQTSSQTGWSGQNTQTNTAYTSGTQGVYTVQTNLSTSTTYYWRSYAIDPGGSNSWSSTQGTPYSFTTTAAPASSTACLIRESANDSQLYIFWTDNATDEDNYEIERQVNAGAWTDLQTGMAANTVNYTDTTISQNNTYRYRIAPYYTGPVYGEWCYTSTLNLGVGSFKIEGLKMEGVKLD